MGIQPTSNTVGGLLPARPYGLWSDFGFWSCSAVQAGEPTGSLEWAADAS